MTGRRRFSRAAVRSCSAANWSGRRRCACASDASRFGWAGRLPSSGIREGLRIATPKALGMTARWARSLSSSDCTARWLWPAKSAERWDSRTGTGMSHRQAERRGHWVEASRDGAWRGSPSPRSWRSFCHWAAALEMTRWLSSACKWASRMFLSWLTKGVMTGHYTTTCRGVPGRQRQSGQERTDPTQLRSYRNCGVGSPLAINFRSEGPRLWSKINVEGLSGPVFRRHHWSHAFLSECCTHLCRNRLHQTHTCWQDSPIWARSHASRRLCMARLVSSWLCSQT